MLNSAFACVAAIELDVVTLSNAVLFDFQSLAETVNLPTSVC
jgi:hypothetical protein